ncbi:AAA family ATPase [Streptomyces sp. NPDC059517]|uniref:AAA family ATPase n=1 Tax=Streptomyces sp. NPDC059517 TaxID=3346855 RepID=UPI00369A21B7
MRDRRAARNLVFHLFELARPSRTHVPIDSSIPTSPFRPACHPSARQHPDRKSHTCYRNLKIDSPGRKILGIRFAICGTHNAGKTTICHEVVSRLMKRGISVAYASEPSRTSRFLAAGTRGSQTQLELFARTIANETEAGRSSSVVICDRSLIDVLAYSDALEKTGLLQEKLILDAMSTFIDSYALTYELFFQIGWKFDMARSVDPLRVDGNEFQEQIQSRIEGHLKRLQIPAVTLTDPDTAAASIEKKILSVLSCDANRHMYVISE